MKAIFFHHKDKEISGISFLGRSKGYTYVRPFGRHQALKVSLLCPVFVLFPGPKCEYSISLEKVNFKYSNYN